MPLIKWDLEKRDKMICDIYKHGVDEWKKWKPLNLFIMNESINCVYSIQVREIGLMPRDVLTNWMKKSESFPLYICVGAISSIMDEFEEARKQFGIKQCISKQIKDDIVSLIEVTNDAQFNGIFPLLHMISGMDDLVAWSTDKDCFFIGNDYIRRGWFKQLPIHNTVREGHSLYYISSGGTNLCVYSNDVNLATFSSLSKSLPSSVEAVFDIDDK